MNGQSRFICLTPCRDEGWVMDLHMRACSTWADRIIVGDQMSSDDSRSLVERYRPSAVLVDNTAEGYDEGERHRVVFGAARNLWVGERKILFAIDADEILSANAITSREWEQIQMLPPGSGIYASWVNLAPGMKAWFPLGGPFIIGVVDDGRIEHSPGQYHVPRLLQDPSAPRLYLSDIKVVHYQYVDRMRSDSKNRAYQVQEWIGNARRPIQLFRRFNSLLKLRKSDYQVLDRAWVQGFAEKGIDWQSVRVDGVYRWDKLVLDAILVHGEKYFSRLDIWDADWNHLAREHGVPMGRRMIVDPRTKFEKHVHRFLRRTQCSMARLDVRVTQWMLRCFGW